VASSLAPLEPASGWAWACGERFEREGSPYPAHQRIACRQQQLELTLLPGLIYRQRALGTASQSRLFRARLMVAKSSPSP
jgi:hypothetical protein